MAPLVDVVIPVLNEERAMPNCVTSLLEFMGESSPYPFRIVIADNGSTDRTPEIAESLSRRSTSR